MKKIGQIRENYNILTEKDDAEMRKLTSLVRAGLFDAKKLPMLKRALNKDPKDMTPAERKILIELLDSLMGEVLGSQQVFQKVRQDVMKEELSEAKTSDGYLSKYDPRYDKMPSEKQIPTIIILKRKAIRIYPDNQKVALYYSQALDKYVTIPFGTFDGSSSMSEEVEYFSESRNVELMPARERFKTKRKIQEDKDKKPPSGIDLAGELATELIPGVSNIKSAMDAYKNIKAGNYGKAAVDAVLATPLGNVAKWIKAPFKVVKAVGKMNNKSAETTKVPDVEVPKTPKAIELPKVIEPAAPAPAKPASPAPPNVLDNLPGVSSSKTPPPASNTNNIEPPKVKPTEELPSLPSSGSSGGKNQPANVNAEAEVKGTGTTGPAPKPKLSEPPSRKDSYNTGVKIIRGAPKTQKPANVNVEVPKVPAPPPAKVSAPANANAPAQAPSTNAIPANAKTPAVNAPAAAPATTPANAKAPATAQAPATSPANALSPRQALNRNLQRKIPNKEEPRKPSLPFSLPDINIDKGLRDPAKFSLAAHISKPKGNVRTGVQKRDDNMFRKSLQNEEKPAAPAVIYKKRVDPAKFGNIRVSTNRPSGNTDVRTGVSARDAMMYRRSLQQNEGILTKLKNVTEGQNLHLTLGDDSVIINKTVANKILTVYESVSKENKKKIEDMLNESVDSVKKIINFVARQ